MIWVAAGILVGMTLLGIPIGILLLMVGGFPLYKVLQKHFVRVAEWEFRDHPLDEGEEEPWIR